MKLIVAVPMNALNQQHLKEIEHFAESIKRMDHFCYIVPGKGKLSKLLPFLITNKINYLLNNGE